MNGRSSIAATCALVGSLAACSPAAESDAATQQESSAAPATAVSDDAGVSHAEWVGKWVGVEGMYVEITPTAEGGYALTMQSDLDTVGTYKGTDADEGIVFERGGQQQLLKAATGDQTGLKYLAGKTDCLMVAVGEGYCRD